MLGAQWCLQPFQQLELGPCAHTFQCPLSHGCLLQCPPRAPHVLFPIPSTAQWGHFHFMGEICKLCCWTHAQGLCRGTPPHTHTHPTFLQHEWVSGALGSKIGAHVGIQNLGLRSTWHHGAGVVSVPNVG